MMNAKTFAEMFIEDLPDTIKDLKDNETFSFSIGVYKDDPDLEILKTELNKVGYDLQLIKKNDNPVQQNWKLIKLD
ncbi:MAG: hypothetical protein J5779_00300 [Clostridia bacterium]|nr:hypothetical protein [Clostridia bacterium]